MKQATTTARRKRKNREFPAALVSTRRSWSVNVDRTEAEIGRSVWEGCPFAPGSRVYLEVVDLPLMAVRIGDYQHRQPRLPVPAGVLGHPVPRFVNGPLLNLGPWPGDTTPLIVGCELNVIPAWDHVRAVMATRDDFPAPTYGSLEGVDCTTLPEVEIWAAVSPVAGGPDNRIRAWPWVRHSTGFWGQPEGTLAPPSAQGHRFVVETRAADRVYCQVLYTSVNFTPGGSVLYGRLTPPPDFQPTTNTYRTTPHVVRFAATLAPAPEGSRNV